MHSPDNLSCCLLPWRLGQVVASGGYTPLPGSPGAAKKTSLRILRVQTDIDRRCGFIFMGLVGRGLDLEFQ